jgi:voltage-gated potassium channel
MTRSRARRFRATLYRQLFPEGWQGKGLSPANKIIVAAILVAIGTSVLETEPTISEQPGFAIAAGILDVIFGTLFVSEYIARLWAAGEDPRFAGLAGRLRYAFAPIALLDLIATAPVVVTLGVTDVFVLRSFRVLRIVLIARLGEFSVAARLLGYAVRARRHELLLSAVIAAVVMLLAATSLYFAEGTAQPDNFGSIPRALWWAIVTLTTVGYGDAYPVTVAGRLLAGLSAVAAIGIIAMPTGILAAGFSEAFRQSRERRVGDPASTP